MELNQEKVLQALRLAPPQGVKAMELAATLVLDAKARHRLRKILEELENESKIERAPGARYRLPEADRPKEEKKPEGSGNEAVGRIRVHPAGYGFVERDDGGADVFVPARHRGTALDGDRVKLITWLGVKGTEGRVVEVVGRGRAKLTGVVRQAGRRLYLEPDDPRIGSTYGQVSLEEGGGGAYAGQCVVAEITRYPETGELAARVIHILGPVDEPRTEVAKVIAAADIPDTFPEDVKAAALRTPQALQPDDFADRIDLRDRAFLTIDPETARDFDDAICLEERPGGYRLWVAVADVSHYVRQGSALDREARIRGCSVYLPDRAIPMLPHELSAEICSLKPDVDRCAMVVRIDLDAAGVPGETAFAAAVIRSRARLDYPGVAAALAGDFRGPRARYQQWIGDLERLDKVARKMRVRRMARGALELDLPEAVVVLDDDDPKLVRDVRRSKASPDVKGAYQLVEEYMLAANEAVARWLVARGQATLWRVHDVPDAERLATFATLARSYGVDFDPEKGATPAGVQKALSALAGQPFERALNFLLLRSLQQARYDTANIGHFGLAATDYLHFTSPIRRYPDLIVHRLLKVTLRKEGMPSGGSSHPPSPTLAELQAMAAESSAHERRAVAAEREVVDMYRAYLMRDRVGEVGDGTVTAVTNFGMFVECDEPFIEGLVKLERLGAESFELDEKGMRLRGRRTGRIFALGDRVRVRIENVSVARRRIDLAIVGPEGDDGEPARPPKPERRRERERHVKGGGGGGGGGKRRGKR